MASSSRVIAGPVMGMGSSNPIGPPLSRFGPSELHGAPIEWSRPEMQEQAMVAQPLGEEAKQYIGDPITWQLEGDNENKYMKLPTDDIVTIQYLKNAFSKVMWFYLQKQSTMAALLSCFPLTATKGDRVRVAWVSADVRPFERTTHLVPSNSMTISKGAAEGKLSLYGFSHMMAIVRLKTAEGRQELAIILQGFAHMRTSTYATIIINNLLNNIPRALGTTEDKMLTDLRFRSPAEITQALNTFNNMRFMFHKGQGSRAIIAQAKEMMTRMGDSKTNKLHAFYADIFEGRVGLDNGLSASGASWNPFGAVMADSVNPLIGEAEVGLFYVVDLDPGLAYDFQIVDFNSGEMSTIDVDLLRAQLRRYYANGSAEAKDQLPEGDEKEFVCLLFRPMRVETGHVIVARANCGKLFYDPDSLVTVGRNSATQEIAFNAKEKIGGMVTDPSGCVVFRDAIISQIFNGGGTKICNYGSRSNMREEKASFRDYSIGRSDLYPVWMSKENYRRHVQNKTNLSMLNVTPRAWLQENPTHVNQNELNATLEYSPNDEGQIADDVAVWPKNLAQLLDIQDVTFGTFPTHTNISEDDRMTQLSSLRTRPMPCFVMSRGTLRRSPKLQHALNPGVNVSDVNGTSAFGRYDLPGIDQVINGSEVLFKTAVGNSDVARRP